MEANIGDDYNIPHWMNHNFYTSPKRRNKTENFIPRIKVPDIVLSALGRSDEGVKGETAFNAFNFQNSQQFLSTFLILC